MRWNYLAAATVVSLACAGCAASTEASEAPPHRATVPAISQSVADQRGEVVKDEPATDLSDPLRKSGATEHRIAYRSASGIDGDSRVVTGAVFVPAGPPPPGGWPIIAYGHGTTGVSNNCGPSLYPDLLGYDLVVASLIKLGFVVALTDYEGLGPTGKHPYLEPITEGFNMIDAVRAARHVVSTASTRWVAFGVSEGGQAAWSANELASDYGKGLDFLGSASMSPTIDVSGLANLAAAGWLNQVQQALLPMTLAGVAVTHPDLNPAAFLHGPLMANPDMWLSCHGPLVDERSQRAAQLKRDDSAPATTQDQERLKSALADLAGPRSRGSGPMLVLADLSDGATVQPAWVRKGAQEACKLGDTLQLVMQNEQTSTVSGAALAGSWLLDRLAGKPAPNNCSSLPPQPEPTVPGGQPPGTVADNGSIVQPAAASQATSAPSEVSFDFAHLPDGDVPGSIGGVPVATIEAGHSAKPASIASGRLVHGAPIGDNAASYLETMLAAPVTRIGATAVFQRPSGSIALVVWQYSLAQARRGHNAPPKGAIHFVAGATSWKLSLFDATRGGEIGLLYGDYRAPGDFAAPRTFEVDRSGDTLTVRLPDGEVRTASDPRVGQWIGDAACWELYELHPGEAPAAFTKAWAS
ncbi:lipase family protein [Skermania sp. ID1734]|uniref:lipase family protein n=1 Tax=Skermania sp. ID1734 TaxID=2597516 RepID=UPI00163DD883|nr:lipase family protein [Skermania sp. ID1734]